jgi:transcription-repair coupling factor (superfamily II helicase)
MGMPLLSHFVIILGYPKIAGKWAELLEMLLIKLIQTEAQCYKFDGADTLRFIKPFSDTEQKLQFVSGLLRKLTPETAT